MPFGPNFTRGDASAVKFVVRIIHLIHAEYSFQTTFVKSLVVRHERESRYLGLYPFPHLRKYWRIFSIGSAKAVHLTAPVVIIFRFRLDERVKLIHHLTVTHYNDANRANLTALVVSRFKIYCGKVLHVRTTY